MILRCSLGSSPIDKQVDVPLWSIFIFEDRSRGVVFDLVLFVESSPFKHVVGDGLPLSAEAGTGDLRKDDLFFF